MISEITLFQVESRVLRAQAGPPPGPPRAARARGPRPSARWAAAEGRDGKTDGGTDGGQRGRGGLKRLACARASDVPRPRAAGPVLFSMDRLRSTEKKRDSGGPLEV